MTKDIGDSLEQLLRISSDALGPPVDFSGKNGLMRSYLDLLTLRNGFFAFESALLVRPGLSNIDSIIDSRTWNRVETWKYAYKSLPSDAFFFAEDVFCNQFGIYDEKVISFEAETGDIKTFCSSLQEWCKLILEDYNLHTGYPIAHDWQERHGPIPFGSRLLFKQPLVLGGSFDIGNFVCWNDMKALRARGALAEQIKDVPDGGQIIFKYVD